MGYVDLPGPFSRAFSNAFRRVRRIITDAYQPTRSEITTLSKGRQVQPLVRAGQSDTLTHDRAIDTLTHNTEITRPTP